MLLEETHDTGRKRQLLEHAAERLRRGSLISTDEAGSGHPTSCLFCAEIMSVLFFEHMRLDANNPDNLHNDQFVLSKGHAAPVLCYVLLGDGETSEGSVWEAASLGAHLGLDNLTAVVDINRHGQSEATMLGHDIEAYHRRFAAFGWNVIQVDGHDVGSLSEAFEVAQSESDRPAVILAATVKGKGVSDIEGASGNHGKPAPSLEDALGQLNAKALETDRELGIHPTESHNAVPKVTIDGFVSIEVDPRLARHTEPTIQAARRIFAAVDRPSCFIKIPGTEEGLPAKTIDVFRDHGTAKADAISDLEGTSQKVIGELSAAGIDLAYVDRRLEDEGIQKFIDPYEEAIAHIQEVRSDSEVGVGT